MSKSVFQQLVEQTCSNANFKPSNNKGHKSPTNGSSNQSVRSVTDPSSYQQPATGNQQLKSSNGRQSAAPRVSQQPASHSEARELLKRALRNMAAPNAATRCHHVKANGVACKSPAMREQPFCFFHEKFYNPPYDDSFPPLEDANSVQCAILQVLNGLKSKLITPLEARVYLYGLKAASINARRTNFEPVQDQVTEYPNNPRREPAITGLEEYRNLASISAPPTPAPATTREIVIPTPSAVEGEGPAVEPRGSQAIRPDKKQSGVVRTASSASSTTSVLDRQLATSN
jgi:hypothetical protein